jgi:PAS domain S-box-containing protein
MESSDLFHEVLNLTADAVLITDEDHSILFVNPAAEALFGYRGEELLGRPIEALIPERSRQRHREVAGAFREAREKIRAMSRREPVWGSRRDGSEFLADITISRHQVDRRLYYAAIVRDRSERMRAEEAIRAGETLHQSIITAMAEGIVLQDAEGKILTCNASAERILGLTTDQILGRTSVDARWRAIHEDGTPFPGEEHPAMVTLRTGAPLSQVVMGLQHPDGKVVWISINSQPLFRVGEGRPYAVVTSFADITQMKRVEMALRESEERYRSMFDKSLEAILLTAPDGQILAANPAACKVFGMTEEEICRAGRAGLVDADDPRLQVALREREASGRYRAEVRMRRGDGTIFPAELSSSIFRDRDGNLRTSMVLRDITERVRLREAVREREELLEQRVGERTRELAAVLQLSHALASTLNLQDLPGLVLDGVRAFVEYDRASLWIIEGSDLRRLGSWPDGEASADEEPRMPAGPVLDALTKVEPSEPALLENLDVVSPVIQELFEVGPELRHGAGAGMIVPLVFKESVVGCLTLLRHTPGTFGLGQAPLLHAIADQAAVAVENSRLYSQIQVAAAQAERSRLARDLHDSVTQMLYSLALFAEAARQQLEQGGLERAEQHLLQIRESAQQALREMRLMVYELRPSALEQVGLVDALRHRVEAVERRAGVEAIVIAEMGSGIPASLEETLYRIAVEALNNSLKHSFSTSVSVSVRGDAKGVALEVQDNGRGMGGPTEDEKGGLGLSSMRERAEHLGGSLTITSAPGTGTLVRAWVPLSRGANTG